MKTAFLWKGNTLDRMFSGMGDIVTNYMIQYAWKIAGTNAFLSKVIAGIGMARKSTYISHVGWYNSFMKRMSIDSAGSPIPWYSYPSLHFLEQRVRNTMRVFEFGCGNSSIWWANRVDQIVSCEHDKEWFDRINDSLPGNAICYYKDESGYADFISGFENEFDIIIIDGIDRVSCALQCLKALNEDGVIIWDNSDRDEYQEGYEYLARNGFKRLDFKGLGPIVMIPTMTSIYYRSANCLGL